MATLGLVATMDAIAAALEATNAVAHAHGWPSEAAMSGEGIVGYPETVDFDMTFGNGATEATFPVWVICGLPAEKDTRVRVDALIAGATSVKTALDGTLSGLVSSAVVKDCSVQRVQRSDGSSFVAVRFDVEVIS